MVALNSIPSVNLGANVVTPVSGNTYLLNNLAYNHWLDDSQSSTQDGNSILAWTQNSPETLNQEVCTDFFSAHPGDKTIEVDEISLGTWLTFGFRSGNFSRILTTPV